MNLRRGTNVHEKLPTPLNNTKDILGSNFPLKIQFCYRTGKQRAHKCDRNIRDLTYQITASANN